MGKVYVVEELFYGEKTTKEVRAVFKNRKKAEEYCSCHSPSRQKLYDKEYNR